jgi:hypothetical protein
VIIFKQNVIVMLNYGLKEILQYTAGGKFFTFLKYVKILETAFVPELVSELNQEPEPNFSTRRAGAAQTSTSFVLKRFFYLYFTRL